MFKWMGLMLCGVILAGCQLLSQPAQPAQEAVRDESGQVITPAKEAVPATTGVIDQVADGARIAGATGVPYLGLAGWVIGLVGAAGTALTAKKGKDDQSVNVRLLNVVKEKAAGFKSDKDVERLIKTFSASNPAWGKRLKKAWAKARSL